MSEEPSLFLPADFFLVRAASLPIDDLHSLLEEANPSQNLIDKWLKDPFFLQALAFSSRSLSSQIRKGKLNEGILLSLFKYFSRITSRGTPYGLLSFVTWGQIGPCLHSRFDWNRLLKRARPDMGWVQQYLQIIFQDKDEFLHFELQNNPLLREKNDRYWVDYFIDKTDQTAASIKKNQLTSLIFSYAQSPLKVSDLISHIQSHFPNYELDPIIRVIQSLLDQQFLWHTLYPKLNTPSPFHELIRRLPEKYKTQWEDFGKKIEEYNSLPLELGETYLYKLADEMDQKASNIRPPVQLDLGISSFPIHLPQQVLDDVAKAGEIAWKFGSLYTKLLPLRTYHTQFLKKYGQQRLIPLLDLLDPNKGLGLPNYETIETKKPVESSDLSRYQEWLGHTLSKALQQQQEEIVIEEETLLRLGTNINKEQAPSSLDLFFEVYANSTEEIESGKYQIHFCNFVERGTATFGRFIHLLNPPISEKIQQFCKEESQLEKEILYIESFYLPQSSNVQNVAMSPAFRPDFIDLSPGSTSTLHLDQIYVGATSDSFYLTDAKGQLEFRFISTNVLVDVHAPEALRFIRQVSRERSGRFELWFWGSHSSCTYLPRVRYKKIILSAARWWTTLDLIGARSNQKVEEIMEALSIWAAQFHLPEYVYITEGDNKLLINWNCKEHIQIAATYLKKDEKIFFVEKICQKKGQWVESFKGKHCVEFVLPVLKNPVYAKKKQTIPSLSYRDYKIADRWKLPSSEWLYYKFYLPAASHHSFLEHHLLPLGEQLLHKGLINEWFFIRYQEDEKHQIRFRVKGNCETLFPSVSPIIHQFSQHLLEAFLIQDVSVCSYEREIERYGGLELIDLCEDYFCADSSLAIELFSFESPEFPIQAIGAISVLDLLNHLQIQTDTAKVLFDSLLLDKKDLKGYKQWKKKIEAGWSNNFGTLGEKRAAILKAIRNKMNDPSFTPSVSISSLAASFIHMHCNRLCGIDPSHENKIKVFAAHSIESRAYYLKGKESEEEAIQRVF